MYYRKMLHVWRSCSSMMYNMSLHASLAVRAASRDIAATHLLADNTAAAAYGSCQMIVR
jgi:hypothetical protein